MTLTKQPPQNPGRFKGRAGGCRWNNGSGVNDSRGGGGGMLWRIYRAARETPPDENGGR
ncbi:MULTISPECIES: hypothetical protein [Nitrosomonas]|uniref:hypothetical protein n=1 Tax=Nitrosomonas TaxID=914 RepID=UPI00137156F3|nr:MULTISPECIES: hypothetical protein [Nitrosomonas]